MRSIGLLLVIILNQIAVDGAKRTKFHRILNGTLASLGQFPFVVAITDWTWRTPICSGSLIAPQHALSAAHCFVDPCKCGIVAGVVNTNSSDEVVSKYKQSRSIILVVLHPEAFFRNGGTNRNHDLAVLKADAQFILSEYVSIIPLAGSTLLERRPCIAAGFGSYTFHLKADGKMRYGKFFVKRSICEKDIPLATCITSNNQSIYYGDSGCPLINANPPYWLYGVCSASHRSLRLYAFTTISTNMKWVRQALNSDQHENFRPQGIHFCLIFIFPILSLE